MGKHRGREPGRSLGIVENVTQGRAQWAWPRAQGCSLGHKHDMQGDRLEAVIALRCKHQHSVEEYLWTVLRPQLDQSEHQQLLFDALGTARVVKCTEESVIQPKPSLWGFLTSTKGQEGFIL